jgi:hypothetical protein
VQTFDKTDRFFGKNVGFWQHGMVIVFVLEIGNFNFQSKTEKTFNKPENRMVFDKSDRFSIF